MSYNKHTPQSYNDVEIDIDVSQSEADFGFSFEETITDDMLQQNSAAAMKEVEDVKSALKEQEGITREILKRVTVLLTALKQSPEKDIHWPNRVEAINNFLSDLNKIYKKEEDGKGS